MIDLINDQQTKAIRRESDSQSLLCLPVKRRNEHKGFIHRRVLLDDALDASLALTRWFTAVYRVTRYDLSRRESAGESEERRRKAPQL